MLAVLVWEWVAGRFLDFAAQLAELTWQVKARETPFHSTGMTTTVPSMYTAAHILIHPSAHAQIQTHACTYTKAASP